MQNVLSDRLALFLQNREVKYSAFSNETDNDQSFYELSWSLQPVVAAFPTIIEIVRE